MQRKSDYIQFAYLGSSPGPLLFTVHTYTYLEHIYSTYHFLPQRDVPIQCTCQYMQTRPKTEISARGRANPPTTPPIKSQAPKMRS